MRYTRKKQSQLIDAAGGTHGFCATKKADRGEGQAEKFGTTARKNVV